MLSWMTSRKEVGSAETKIDWNTWLGEAPRTSPSAISNIQEKKPILQELRILLRDTKAHRWMWLVAAPATAMTVSRYLPMISSFVVPALSTSFAAVSRHHSSPLGHMAQLGSSILMMLSIKGLGSHGTSKRGNYYGIAGVSTAVLTVILSQWTGRFGLGSQFYWFLPVAAVGQYVGVSIAKSVQMDEMPELVAAFHSLTGLAAVFVGIASQMSHGSGMPIAKMVEIFLGVSVGAATFSGSIAAAAKLHGLIPGGPIGLNSRFTVNTVSLVKLGLLLTAYIGFASPGIRIAALCGNALVSLVLGTMLVLPVGGSDLPIVISLLNSLSGLATSATGFSLDNSLLVMTGALIASSGALLSEHMCKGINRSLGSVLMGGFGVDNTVAGTTNAADLPQEIVAVNVAQVIQKLQQCKRVLVVPGYGMAVARCQAGVAEVFEELQKRGVQVQFGIHPVAGRLPGHMNVILSEAGIPYDVVKELGEVNAEIEDFDLCIVLGANDIVNPATASDPTSPIFGMPAIECWNCKHVVVMKRSMNTGYSGVDNPLFYLPNTSMLFGDAKETVEKLQHAILDTDPAQWSAAGSGKAGQSNLGGFVAEAEPSTDFSELPVYKSLGALSSVDVVGERRIPISPKVTSKLRQMGFAVVVASGIGEDCGWSDSVFEKYGATVVASERLVMEQCDVILKVTPLTNDQLGFSPPPEQVEKKQILITSFPIVEGQVDALLSSLSTRRLTTFNLNLVPRISRAQAMDILSSMANLAGYKAVINAFHRIGKLSRSSVTAGGNIPAARVFVVGCGVAGLSAIATAHALGATVLATDVRPATKEQVESIGAKFIEVEPDVSVVENGGYAGEVTASFAEKQKQLYRDYAASADIVITTAMVPGKKAPRLISVEMVRLMKPGSIVVDMAAPSGGNCELTVLDQIMTDPVSKVIIDGTGNYASELAQLSSELFSQNCLSFLENLCGKPKTASSLDIDTNDVIIRQSLVVHEDQLMYPPPPLPPPVAPQLAIKASIPPALPPSKTSDEAMLLIGALALGTLGLSADHRTVRLVGDFVLSCVIGHFTVASVTPALHTPLIRYASSPCFSIHVV